ncbi:DNA primase [Enterococcus phage Entf1]|nr:DNA primase [Enterococcus phage Entf1]
MLDLIHLSKDIKIHVDIQSFLMEFEWERAKWTEDRLIAASPFRDDNHPSFFVNFNNDFAGTWGDSGSGESGNFIELVSRLYETDYETAFEMLKERYWTRPYEAPSISVKLGVKKEKSIFDIPVHNPSPYLLGRGISEETQQLYRTSEDESKVCLPYINGMGLATALKYRRTDNKDFFYEAGNNHLKNMLFGYHVIYEKLPNTLVICEAEIDAMTAYEMGFVGISLGAANLIERQVDLIKKVEVKNIIIGTDNDEKGNLAAKSIDDAFWKTHKLFRYDMPSGYDLNQYWQEFHKAPPLKKISEPKLLRRKLWYIQ